MRSWALDRARVAEIEKQRAAAMRRVGGTRVVVCSPANHNVLGGQCTQLWWFQEENPLQNESG